MQISHGTTSKEQPSTVPCGMFEVTGSVCDDLPSRLFLTITGLFLIYVLIYIQSVAYKMVREICLKSKSQGTFFQK